ncbi:MAG: CBS domain-containing protein [Pseudomonadota bacterium]|nr:MAG: histidine kinase [Pseudomonadota bacterium]
MPMHRTRTIIRPRKNPKLWEAAMKARDIMSKNVITVRRETSVHEIAQLMTDKRISGVPVVAEDGTILGMVSESDLLRRAEIGTEPQRKWWLSFFSDPDLLARQYRKTHGLKAEDVMSRPVVTIDEDADLSEIANTFEKRRVKRLPVVRDGKLVGIISRADIVKALSQSKPQPEKPIKSDAELEQALLAKIREQDWLDGTFLNVVVQNGVVELNGFVPSAEQRRALHVLVEEMDGVQKIEDRLVLGSPSLRGV